MAISLPFLEKCVFRFLEMFYWIDFLYWALGVCVEINSLVSLAMQMFLRSVRSHLFIFICPDSKWWIKTELAALHVKTAFCFFSWGVPLYLSFYLDLLNLFAFIFVYGVRESFNFILTFMLRNLARVLHSGHSQFPFPESVWEGSLGSTPSPAFIVCRVSAYGHSHLCEVIHHWSFDLHFSHINDADIFPCDFFKQCELNLLIEVDFLNPDLYLIVFHFPMTCLEYFFRAGDFFTYSPSGLMNIKCSWALVLKLLLCKIATGWEHIFITNSGSWGNQNLGESPVPGLSGMCQKKHPRLVSHPFLSYPIPWTHPSSCTTPLGKVLSSIGGVILRKEAGGGNPTNRRHGAHGSYQSSSSPEAPRPLGAVGVVSLQDGPPGSGGCGLMQRGRGWSGPRGRAHWLAHPPQLCQPHDSPSLGNQPAQASGLWQQPRSPRPERNRVRILFL